MLTTQSAVASSTTSTGPRLHPASTRFNYIAQRNWLSVTLIGIIAFLGSAAVALIVGIREPKLHDEFSYLLAADTFAHGRLTNPTHPMWIHFESFHIIQQPTYMSKYPPAQGLVLAAGQLIAGHPIVGVWLSFALMCAAICWMLYAWVSPRWAVLGGVLALINPVLGIAGYWAQSYWGGAVAAIGGALVLGGIRRLMRKPQVSVSLITGIGLAILANSRPFEGLLISLPAGIFLLIHIVHQHGQTLWLYIGRVAAPILIVLTLTIVGMGFYNLGVTGHPLRLTYQIHEKTYSMAPLFLWQRPLPEPEYRHEVIHEFHKTYALPFHANQRSILGFLVEDVYVLLTVGFRAINIFVIPLILAFSVLLPWMWRDRLARRALVIYVVLLLGMLTETFKGLHYAAPITGLMYFFILSAWRLARWHNRKLGHLLLWLTPILAIAALVISLRVTIARDDMASWHIQRAQLLRQLQQKDGEHLIVVNYGSEHSFHNEWVYNKADIDRAKVIFARALNNTQDCQLVAYFKSRQIWSLEIDADQTMAKLKPYPLSLCK